MEQGFCCGQDTEAVAVPDPDPFGRFVLVSFFTPGPYYEACAATLAAACRRFGVAHDIVRIDPAPGETWADICRRKPGFCRDMLERHGCDILWVDVDCDLLRDPRPLHQGHFDIALFARGFKYLARSDTLSLSRTFHPGYIVLRHTPRMLGFLADCQEIERSHEGEFTDDYILEEAFRTSPAELRIMLLSPDDIEKPDDPPKPGAFFRHGDSGNVKEYIGKVRQHVPHLLDYKNQKRLMMPAVQEASAEGRFGDAMAFLRYMIALMPEDPDTHVKALRVLQGLADAEALAAEIARGRAHPDLRPFTLRHQLQAALAARSWDSADQLFAELEETGATRLIDPARALMFRHGFDRRAAAAGIAHKDRPAVFWRDRPLPGAIGEVINPYVVERLSGRIPRFVSGGKGICMAGTFEDAVKPGTRVWGGGLSEEDVAPACSPAISAVRGPRTRAALQAAGLDCPEIYGDCASLLPLVFRPEAVLTHRTGLVCLRSEVPAGAIDPEIRLIEPVAFDAAGIEAFIRALCGCSRIIATSLYGMAIALAYGIPCAWAETAKRPSGRFQIRDHLAALGLETVAAPLDLRQARLSDDSLPAELFLQPRHRPALGPLLAAAPFAVLPSVLAAAQQRDLALAETGPAAGQGAAG